MPSQSTLGDEPRREHSGHQRERHHEGANLATIWRPRRKRSAMIACPCRRLTVSSQYQRLVAWRTTSARPRTRSMRGPAGTPSGRSGSTRGEDDDHREEHGAGACRRGGDHHREMRDAASAQAPLAGGEQDGGDRRRAPGPSRPRARGRRSTRRSARRRPRTRPRGRSARRRMRPARTGTSRPHGGRWRGKRAPRRGWGCRGTRRAGPSRSRGPRPCRQLRTPSAAG